MVVYRTDDNGVYWAISEPTDSEWLGSEHMSESLRTIRQGLTRAIVLPRDCHLEWITPYKIVKPHPLDVKYPHVCFKCKKPLEWTELLNVNRTIEFDQYGNIVTFDMTIYKRLKKLWRSQVIEFYCCECFNIKENYTNLLDDIRGLRADVIIYDDLDEPTYENP